MEKKTSNKLEIQAKCPFFSCYKPDAMAGWWCNCLKCIVNVKLMQRWLPLIKLSVNERTSCNHGKLWEVWDHQLVFQVGSIRITPVSGTSGLGSASGFAPGLCSHPRAPAPSPPPDLPHSLRVRQSNWHIIQWHATNGTGVMGKVAWRATAPKSMMVVMSWFPHFSWFVWPIWWNLLGCWAAEDDKYLILVMTVWWRPAVIRHHTTVSRFLRMTGWLVSEGTVTVLISGGSVSWW